MGKLASLADRSASASASAVRPDRLLEGVAESKIADFARETVADAGVMRDVAPAKRTALLACMVHVARPRARDDLAEMFCKRMASITSSPRPSWMRSASARRRCPSG